MIVPPIVTPALLRRLLTYNALTGLLFWKARDREFFTSDRQCRRWNTRYAGKRAFTVNLNGYRDGMIFRKMHRAHQVAWQIYFDEPSPEFIDHINGDRDDNRMVNLRAATRSENCRNAKRNSLNTSGVTGVAPLRNRWRAYIRVGLINKHLGVFDTLEEAAAARQAASAAHGYHPNHGRPPPPPSTQPENEYEHL